MPEASPIGFRAIGVNLRGLPLSAGFGAIRLAMQRTMQRHCAVFRTGSLLEEGPHKLDDVFDMMGTTLPSPIVR